MHYPLLQGSINYALPTVRDLSLFLELEALVSTLSPRDRYYSACKSNYNDTCGVNCAVDNVFPALLWPPYIGVGSEGGRGATRPSPQVSSWGGIAPPTLPTVYIMNFIAVLDIDPHLCQLTGEGNHVLAI